MRRALQAIGTGLQIAPMVAIGVVFGTMPIWVAYSHVPGSTGLNPETIGSAYGFAVLVVGLIAIRSLKAAVLEALLAGIPLAIAVAQLVKGQDALVAFAIPPAISLVGFAIRVLAMPEPAGNRHVSRIA